ncbi:MAG: hypothetical protein JTT11_07595 [Candidatus Brockarchaeota archaeon]|nr:hypothetical protein [Candidatus Brockarchaeota archaeon]
MTPKERLLASLLLEEPDAVPVSVRINGISEPWLEEAGVLEHLAKTSDVLTSESVYGGGSFCLTSAAKPELVFIGKEGGLRRYRVETPKGDLTSVTRETVPGRPHIGTWTVKPFLEGEGDVEKLMSIPYAPPVLDARPFFDRARRVGDRGLVYVGLSDPVGILSSLFSLETFLLFCIKRTDLVKELLDAFLQRLLDVVERSLELGAGPFYELSGAELVCPTFLPPSYFREFVVRYDEPIVKAVHAGGGFAMMHCHGKVGKVLESFQEMGLEAVHPVEGPPAGDVELSEAKRRIGGSVCIRGNVQLAFLDRARPPQVEDACRRAIEDAAAGGGFVLEPTATPLPNTPVENVCAFVEAARKHGAGCRKGAEWMESKWR